MSINVIIQARLGSTRFPEKVLKKINNKTIIEILIERLKLSKKIDKIIVAVPEKNNKKLIDHIKNLNHHVFCGSEQNVLSRFYNAALKYKSQSIIRITADCPLIDPFMLDEMIDVFNNKKLDYISNAMPPSFPDGLDIEIFKFESLKKTYLNAKSINEKEHVTPYLINSSFIKKENFSSDKDFSMYRITLDEQEDFQVIKSVIDYFHPKIDFKWFDIKNLISNKPKIFLQNKNIKRNEGAEIGTGQKLWKRAKNIIPGGNMLLSKRSEMFLPNKWPSYFSKAKGCKVWDLDNNELIDMSIMGIGTNSLGYGNPEVDDAVMTVVNKGNMSTLNCPEEVYLAEKLINLHPWSDMARFARSGGEANAIAIRIARAATGKDKVAICGYHGWHDWYLATNLDNKENLSEHLLPGLDPAGVPSNLKGSVLAFEYNNYEQLENIINNNEIGIIKMEVLRNHNPKNNFLKKVRKLATDNNIVLIFDECSSGFRQTFGGIHKLYDVDPDMAMFGKTLGNGYAITAVLGKKDIMEAAQNTFISSTFWTERIGSAAALKTLEVMEKIKSWEIITKIGQNIQDRWKELALKHSIKLETQGIPAFANFNIKSKNWLKYKTYITQEMLKKGYLASNAVYVCTEHKKNIIDEYFLQLETIFKTISDCESGDNIDKLLETPVCHSGFKRLN